MKQEIDSRMDISNGVTASIQTPPAATTAAKGPIETDAVIVGAGPVGLFQVFELGLLEIKAHVIDSLPAVGGQCVELYPDKPIYDIPAVPVCTGQELTDNLLKQIAPFEPTFHLGQEVSEVERLEDGRFHVGTSVGTRFITKTIFIAAGVGSFQPRTIKVEGIEQFENKQLFYRVKDPARFEGKNLVICGGGDSALDWALNLAGKAESVILLHRREEFRAAPASVAKMKEMCDNYEMQFVVGQVTGFEAKDDQLSEIKVTGADGVTRRLPLDHLLVFFGLSPKLGPIAEWGLDIERKQLKVGTEKFETNVPGIFAVGDINTYPGKKKLILSGFHEAALAAFGAAPYIFPEKKIHMQYTTTSPKLHKILGVETPVFD
ncbi:MAG: NAD(P)/FAD-dependent oxidoreductase [Noviherbaspirillum sp.]|nr:NAD(P)/FAD-dependent oxidoreductase [Noviherbaspirillum sp.]